jgi:hypothetical protein
VPKLIRNLLLAGLLLALGAGGTLFMIYGNRDGTVKIHLTQARIAEALARKFPKERTYLKIIKVTYANPRVVMVPEQEKVRVGLDVRVEVGLKGFGKTYQGGAEITTKVGYHPAAYEFYLREAQLEALDIPKLSAKDLELVKNGLNVIADEFVENIPVYRLTQQDTKTQLAKLLLKDLTIQRDEVVATLGL